MIERSIRLLARDSQHPARTSFGWNSSWMISQS
jgi:hypothetical protein